MTQTNTTQNKEELVKEILEFLDELEMKQPDDLKTYTFNKLKMLHSKE